MLLVLAPLDFPAVARALSELGWSRTGSSDPDPLVARFVRKGRAERLGTGAVVMTFNRATGLRALQLVGHATDHADAIARVLPVVSTGLPDP